MRKGYTTSNIFYGRDSKNKNIMVYAFKDYVIADENEHYYFIRQAGKGNHRIFAVNKQTENFVEVFNNADI